MLRLHIVYLRVYILKTQLQWVGSLKMHRYMSWWTKHLHQDLCAAFVCLVTSAEGWFGKGDHRKQYCTVAVQALMSRVIREHVKANAGSNRAKS